MKQAIVLRLQDEGLASEYKKRHDEIWPELVEEFAVSGIQDMEIFLRGKEVIIVSEVVDSQAWTRLWTSPVHKRWDQEMSRLLEYDGNTVRADSLERVFSLSQHRRAVDA